MRDFLNAILAFIGAASLTDEEFSSLTIESAAYDQQTYVALFNVLESRSGLSTSKERLKCFFIAKGVLVAEENPTAKSNILIGEALC